MLMLPSCILPDVPVLSKPLRHRKRQQRRRRLRLTLRHHTILTPGLATPHRPILPQIPLMKPPHPMALQPARPARTGYRALHAPGLDPGGQLERRPLRAVGPRAPVPERQRPAPLLLVLQRLAVVTCRPPIYRRHLHRVCERRVVPQVAVGLVGDCGGGAGAGCGGRGGRGGGRSS